MGIPIVLVLSRDHKRLFGSLQTVLPFTLSSKQVVD